MGKTRLEAFSDGVFAIIITIMVLELKVPHEDKLSDSIAALKPLLPVFLSYILSFVYVAIYWNNHHHLFNAVQGVNGKVLWANNFLLFWLSLLPFATAWMGENHFAKWPVIVYGCILFLAGCAYYILVKVLITAHNSSNHKLKEAIGKDKKGIASVILCIAGILVCFISPYMGCCMYALVSIMWFIPDKRIEKKITEN